MSYLMKQTGKNADEISEWLAKNGRSLDDINPSNVEEIIGGIRKAGVESPEAIRERVLRNIEISRQARESSNISEYFKKEREILDRGTFKQVDYGSTDLSKDVIKYRIEQKIKGPRNVAVFEYIDSDGSIKTLTGASVRGKGHAERLIAKQLNDMEISPSQVKRIYSELEPCTIPGGYCKRFIQTIFPDAATTYSFEYGVDAASRERGISALKKALTSIFGGN